MKAKRKNKWKIHHLEVPVWDSFSSDFSIWDLNFCCCCSYSIWIYWLNWLIAQYSLRSYIHIYIYLQNEMRKNQTIDINGVIFLMEFRGSSFRKNKKLKITNCESNVQIYLATAFSLYIRMMFCKISFREVNFSKEKKTLTQTHTFTRRNKNTKIQSVRLVNPASSSSY